MRRNIYTVALGLALVFAGVPGRAEAPGEVRLKTRVASAALFKNGLGFVTREGAWPAGAVKALIEGLPVPVHGTFWVYAPGHPEALTDLTAFQRTSVEPGAATSLSELLDANVGRAVEVRASGLDPLRGKIVSPSAGPKVSPDTRSEPEGRMIFPPPETPSLLLLDTAKGPVALDRRSVQQVTGVDGALNARVERTVRRAALELHGAGGADPLRVLYLARGITWAPSYALDLAGAKGARLTAKAEVINELEDLDGATLSFITGFPNLKFADVDDPMGMRGDLAAFLNALQSGAGRVAGGLAGVMRQAVMASEEAAFPAYSTGPIEGQSRENLFFYERRDVTLARGERGYYPLFTLEVPCEPLYELKLGDALGAGDRYAPEAGGEEAHDVWYSVKLTNAGKVPWSTAPVMAMQGGQMLAQDVLNYTSVGGKSTVRINKAVDIKADAAEYEVERKRGVTTFYGYSYDLVDVKGQVSATSFKDQAITLTLTKDLSGEVVSSTPPAHVEVLARGLKQANPNAHLTWELPLKARGKVEVEYSYRIYVRQ